MDWLQGNWLWLLFIIVVFAMHMFGHGGHGGGHGHHRRRHDHARQGEPAQPASGERSSEDARADAPPRQQG